MKTEYKFVLNIMVDEVTYNDIVQCFKIRKIAVCFLWLSLPGHYRVTDEASLAETT